MMTNEVIDENGNNRDISTITEESNHKNHYEPEEADRFNGSTYGDLEDFLKGRMEFYKSLDEKDSDKKKREASERRQKNLAAIGDILGSFHNAYSYQRGVKPMDLTGISDKYRERLLKEKSEREKNREMTYKYASMLSDLKSKESQEHYRNALLSLREMDTERKLSESQARIENLVMKGLTEEARQELLAAQELLAVAKAEGQRINNSWISRLNSAEVNLKNAQSEKAKSGGGMGALMKDYEENETIERDEYGNIVSRKKKRTVGRSSEDDTPPSRRNNSSNNTPPSRR